MPAHGEEPRNKKISQNSPAIPAGVPAESAVYNGQTESVAEWKPSSTETTLIAAQCLS